MRTGAVLSPRIEQVDYVVGSVSKRFVENVVIEAKEYLRTPER